MLKEAKKILENAGWVNEKGRFFHTYGQMIDAHMETNHAEVDTLRLMANIQDSLTEEGKYSENFQAYEAFLNLWNPVKN